SPASAAAISDSPSAVEPWPCEVSTSLSTIATTSSTTVSPSTGIANDNAARLGCAATRTTTAHSGTRHQASRATIGSGPSASTTIVHSSVPAMIGIAASTRSRAPISPITTGTAAASSPSISAHALLSCATHQLTAATAGTSIHAGRTVVRSSRDPTAATTLMPIHHHESAAPPSSRGPATSACLHPSIANAVPCPSSRCASIHATTPCHAASPKLASANVDGAWPNANAAAAQLVSPPINSRASAWPCSAASSSARSSRQAETTLAP